MATIATMRAIPFGGDASQKKLGAKAYKAAFHGFFKDFGSRMKEFYPRYKEKVSFIFSDFENEPWRLALIKAITDAQSRDCRIGKFEFVNHKDKNGRGYPCQAADLFAYRNRQKMETIYESGKWQSMRLLDLMFARTGRPRNLPLARLRTLSDSEWSDWVTRLRTEKKEHESRNVGNGQKSHFLPLRHSLALRTFLGLPTISG
jgi:hypothetical protein